MFTLFTLSEKCFIKVVGRLFIALVKRLFLSNMPDFSKLIHAKQIYEFPNDWLIQGTRGYFCISTKQKTACAYKTKKNGKKLTHFTAMKRFTLGGIGL